MDTLGTLEIGRMHESSGEERQATPEVGGAKPQEMGSKMSQRFLRFVLFFLSIVHSCTTSRSMQVTDFWDT